METEKEASVEINELTGISVRKRNFLSVMLWLVILATIVVTTLFPDKVSIMFLLPIWIWIWLLAKRWGKKFDLVMFPRPFTNAMKVSRVYRVYAAAMRREWSAILLVSNVFVFTWLSASLFPDMLNPVLDLSEMNVTKGVITRLTQAGVGRRSNAYVWLQTTEGKVVKLKNTNSYADYQYLKNLKDKDEITVWSQLKWGLGPIRARCIWQLQHNDYLLLTYSKERVLRLSAIQRKIDTLSIMWTMFTLIIVWLKTPEQITEGEKNE